MSLVKRSFLVRLGILTAVLAAAAVVVYLIKPEWVYPGVPFLFIYFVGLSILEMYLSQKAKVSMPERSATIHLAIMSGRLILSIIVVALFIILDTQHKLAFVADFFTLYLFYAIFDINRLVANLRPDFGEG